MKSTLHFNRRLACAAAFLVVSATVEADLLGVQPDYPQIDSGGGSSSATIDPTASPSFNSVGQTLTLTLTSGSVAYDVFGNASTTIQVDVDALCAAISGVPADDLLVTGDVYDESFNIIKSGILLTGEITEAGNSMATDTTAAFDFRAAVTGGVLVTDGDWPLDTGGNPVDAGILVTLEGTSVTFTTNDCSVYLTSTRSKAIIGPDVSVPPDFTNPGTGTQGYWRNHPDAWPVEEITVGGITYAKSDAIDLMDRAPKGDKTYNMFRQLVSAMLNVLIGNDNTCIQTEIDDANQWLVDNPLGSNVRAKDDPWSLTGDMLHESLDSYNNGQLCAPHRDT